MVDIKGSGGMIVDTTCIYEYMGLSPNERPASAGQPYIERKLSFSEGGSSPSAPNATADVNDTATQQSEESGSTAGYEDISGVWERVKSVNMESVLGATGAGFMARKMGASMALCHTITLNPPHFTALRLQEKGGPIDSDVTLTIGADLVDGVMTGKPVKQQAYWNDAGQLIFRRVLIGRDAELIMTRFIEGGELAASDKQLVLKTLHRDLRSGTEGTGNTISIAVSIAYCWYSCFALLLMMWFVYPS